MTARISPLCAALCILLCAASDPDDVTRTPEAVARSEAKLEGLKRERLKELEEEVGAADHFLATVQKAAVRRGARGDPEIGPFATADGKQQAVARAKKRADRARQKLIDAKAAPAADAAKALVRNVGEIGLPAQHQFRVFQIVGDEDMIADNFPERVWLHGFPTKGLVDDRVIEIDRPVVVSGTKHYAGNTMLFVEPYTPAAPQPQQ